MPDAEVEAVRARLVARLNALGWRCPRCGGRLHLQEERNERQTRALQVVGNCWQCGEYLEPEVERKPVGRLDDYDNRQDADCRVCGALFQYAPGGKPRYCSTPCRLAGERLREQERRRKVAIQPGGT